MIRKCQKTVQIYLEVRINFNLELLSPDIKSRIKVRDIFFHPWVIGFEKEYKEQILNKANSNFRISTDKGNVVEKIKNYNSNENKENISKENYKSTEENSKSHINISKEKINIMRDLTYEKVEIIDKNFEKLNENLNEFSLFDKNINLFDKVLNQVQEKNKSKKKKLKQEFKKEIKIDIDQFKEDKYNEGVKIMEKKDSFDKDNYSILDDISILESKISEYEKKNQNNENNKNLINVKKNVEKSPFNFTVKTHPKAMFHKDETIKNTKNSNKLNDKYAKEFSLLDNNLNDFDYIKCNTEKEKKKNIIDNKNLNKHHIKEKNAVNDNFNLIEEDVDQNEDKFKKIYTLNNINKYDSFDFKYNDKYDQLEKKKKKNNRYINDSLEIKYIDFYDKIKKETKKNTNILSKNKKIKNNYKSQDIDKEYFNFF